MYLPRMVEISLFQGEVSMLEISKEILIEDLVAAYPYAVKFLREKGIRCLACGEPIWGTLGAAATEKGFTNDEIDAIVKELNVILVD